MRAVVGAARGALLALAVGVAAVVAPLVASVAARRLAGGRMDLFLDRNLLAAWAPLNIALVAGLLVRRIAVLGTVALSALSAASLLVVVQTSTDPSLQRDD